MPQSLHCIYIHTLKKAEMCIAVFYRAAFCVYATTKENGYDTLARNGLVNIVILTMLLWCNT